MTNINRFAQVIINNPDPYEAARIIEYIIIFDRPKSIWRRLKWIIG